MTADLSRVCWPTSSLGDALERLGRDAGLLHRELEASPPDNNSHPDREALAGLIRAEASRLGLEAQPAEVTYGELDGLLRSAAPALICLPGMNGPSLLAVSRRKGKSLLVLGPDLLIQELPIDQVRSALCREVEAPLQSTMDSILAAALTSDMPQQERARVEAAFLGELLASVPICGIWLLRLGPGASFLAQVRHAGLLRRIAAMAITHTFQYLLLILSWFAIGGGILRGHFDPGWLMAWVLVLFTLLPLQALTSWYQALLAIGGGGLLKRHLLHGVLRLEPEEIRNQGAGQLLGRVIESEAVESLALNAGLVNLLAVIDLVVAGAVLKLGAGGWLHVALLAGWIIVAFVIGWSYWSRCLDWTSQRLGMTHDLVEKMAGHRTRLVQELDERRHQGEDEAVERYLRVSQAMDHTGALAASFISPGWLILGIIGLAPAFISSSASTAKLAVGLGGVLLANQALDKLMIGLVQIAQAAISWSQVSPISRAATRPETIGCPAFACARLSNPKRACEPELLLEAHDLVFRHSSRSEPVLQGLNLRIYQSERLLLEGVSGSGKSTLASLLSGLRAPQSGSILLGGLDHTTLGSEEWRRRVAMVPQFHENHIMTESLAFNLLMGRRWPPTPEDLNEAEEVCRELGLGDLLERMPAGLSHMVGETGWQLSHGERSRVFIARALLQQPDLIIFDESFGALDPENLLKVLRCASQRANTMLAIAHP
jgi:ATP-binding cassette, subfamily B, bacterial